MSKRFLGEKEAQAFLENQPWGSLATIGPDGAYIVPMHYAVDQNTIFFHSALNGTKLDNIRADNRVCFEVSRMDEIIKHQNPCKFSTKFISVQVFGKAEIVTEPEKKKLALNLIAKKYATGTFEPVNQQQTSTVAVIALHIQRISGRVN